LQSPRLEEPAIDATPDQQNWLTRMGDVWCRMMHRDVMWPIHGKFQCRKCFRLHPITWGGRVEDHSSSMSHPANHPQVRPKRP
jgi:hypothetical protein